MCRSDRRRPFGGLKSGVHPGGGRVDQRIAYTVALFASDHCVEERSIVKINYSLRCCHFLAFGGALIVDVVDILAALSW